MNALAGALRRQLANLMRIGRLVGRRLLLQRDRENWIEVKLGGLGELATGVGFGGGEPSLGLFELLRILDRAADDDRVSGVLLRFDAHFAGWSLALALRRAVLRLAEQGKTVVAWGAVLNAEQYLVASACGQVWLPESGTLGLVGLRSEHFYLKDLLEKWEVVPEVVRVGKFKSAGEMLTRDSMSDEQREQIDGWQQDLYTALVEGIAAGRGLSPEAVRERIDEGPYPARAALDVGLVDACLYPDEIDAALRDLAERETPAGSPAGSTAAGERELVRVKAHAYGKTFGLESGWQPLLEEVPSIAYVTATGAIRRGASRRGITWDRLGPLFEQLRESRAVCGVVLRLDTPGGDAVASDLLHRSLEQLAVEKPVVISMGNVAASGGYYMAAAGHAILAEVGTVTGSIGVVGGKVNVAGLYDRLGIGKDAVQTGARAGLYAEDRGFSDDERDVVARGMEELYRIFLARVAQGRGMSPEEVREIAEGRIWSGLRASEVGLVDGLGGPLEAVDEVRRRAGLADHERYNLELHPRRSPMAGLRELLFALTEGG